VPALHADTLVALGRVLAELGAPCLVHCEDDAITARAEQDLRGSGRVDGGIVPAWRSREAEIVSVAGVAVIARATRARMIVAHASNADVLELVARERAAGSPVLAETCPQYLHLREDEVVTLGALRKFTPPARIRSNDDEARMWDALNRGLVRILSSDHAPATLEQKRDGDVWEVPFGLPGIDTTFPIMLDAALEGRISVERLVDLYATAPAALYGLAGKGRIEPGGDADLVLVDPTARCELADDAVISKAGWTPYAGRRLRGRVVASVLRGEVIARDGAPPAGEPRGRFVSGAGAR
jgi:dihydroorotase